jgi:hypothetical protein
VVGDGARARGGGGNRFKAEGGSEAHRRRHSTVARARGGEPVAGAWTTGPRALARWAWKGRATVRNLW